MPVCDQPSGQGLLKSLAKMATVFGPFGQQVLDSPEELHYPVPIPLLDVRGAHVRFVENKDSRHLGAAAEVGRHGHMELGRHKVGEFVQTERSLMGVHPQRFVVSAT